MKIKIIFKILLIIGMIILTIIAFHPDGNIFFSGTCSEYTVTLIRGNLVLATLSLFLFCVILIYFTKHQEINKVIKLLVLGIFFLVWFLNSRTIAFTLYPDGIINTGWFCIETNKFNLCNENDKGNYEIIIYQETKIKKYLIWFIRIENKNIDKYIFVGPFLWYKTLKAIDDEFYLQEDKKLSPIHKP